MVFWITGLSGAGKTTIGKLLYEYIKKEQNNTVFLDGDTLREVFGNDLKFTREERMKSAMRNARLCALLSAQDIHVVCSTISMFDGVREWNRNNIKSYIEIYVDVPDSILFERNSKGLYNTKKTTDVKDVAGIDVEIEKPANPDLTLYNDGRLSPTEQVAVIIKRFSL